MKLDDNERVWNVARFVLGLCGLLALVALVAHALRPQIENVGRWFVESAGYAGMAAGTLLADGFHFPIPPQFYMLLAIASSAPGGWVLLSICIGSILGGALGFVCAGKLARIGWLRRRVQASPTFETLRRQVGTRGLAALSFTPIAFSWLIYYCGVNRYPWHSAALLCALRVPKLLLYYWLVRAGWLA